MHSAERAGIRRKGARATSHAGLPRFPLIPAPRPEFGDLSSQNEMTSESMRALQLVVSDAAAGRDEFVSRGVERSELVSFGDQDGSTFFGFSDPDGNTWSVQELKLLAERPAQLAGRWRPISGNRPRGWTL